MNSGTVSTVYTKGIEDFCHRRYGDTENYDFVARMYSSDVTWISEISLYCHHVYSVKPKYKFTTVVPVYLVKLLDEKKNPIKIPENTEFIVSAKACHIFIIDCFDETIHFFEGLEKLPEASV